MNFTETNHKKRIAEMIGLRYSSSYLTGIMNNYCFGQFKGLST